MKRIKEEKGITLVALIITIVVLLILAAVAIGTVRDSDIIEYAKNAAGSYNQAKNNELSEIQSAEDLLKQYASKQNPWVAKGLTIPVEYGKKYSGPVAPGLGLSSLTITLGANGELIVEETGINSTCNDSKIASITSNTITYIDGSNEIKIEFSADGKSAEVFYNNNKLGTIEPKEDKPIPNTVWTQRGLTVQPVEIDVTYSCEGTIAFGGTSLTNGLVIELHADGGFYISYGNGNLTEEHGTAVISGNNTITFMAGEEETFKIVISNDASEATVFGMFGTWQEGDKTLTLNTVSAE